MMAWSEVGDRWKKLVEEVEDLFIAADAFGKEQRLLDIEYAPHERSTLTLRVLLPRTGEFCTRSYTESQLLDNDPMVLAGRFYSEYMTRESGGVSFETSVDPAKGLVTMKQFDPYTADDIIATLSGLFNDPDYRPGMRFLWDTRYSTDDLSADDVQRIVHFVRMYHNSRGQSRTAVVAPRETQVGIARMAQLHASEGPTQIAVFREVDEALAWLDSTP